MADIPYTQSPGNIKKVFNEIQTSGKPDKIHVKWLEMHGLKSKNDRRLIPMLKFLGFTDDSGKPNDSVWLAYKHRENASSVLGKQIQIAYSDLFRVYPDASRKDDEALRNYFNSKTGLAANVVGFIVNTFKNLCELATFDAGGISKEAGLDETPEEKPKAKNPKKNDGMSETGVTINVNIQLQIAAVDDAAIYDKFFESLYKNVIAKQNQS